MDNRLTELLIKSYNATTQAEWTDFLRNNEETDELEKLVDKYMAWKDENLFYNS